MAVPSYTTDLTTIATGDLNVDAGTWDESTDAGWDTAGSMVDDQNLYYNNSECVSAQYTKDGSGSGAAGPGSQHADRALDPVPRDDAAAAVGHGATTASGQRDHQQPGPARRDLPVDPHPRQPGRGARRGA